MKHEKNPPPSLTARLLEHEREATRIAHLEVAAVAAHDALDLLLRGDMAHAPLTSAERIEIETACHCARRALRSITMRRETHARSVPR